MNEIIKRQIGNATLYCGDCREVLPLLPPHPLQAVIADIPYAEVNRESGGLRTLDRGRADEATFDILDVLPSVARLNPSSTYIFCGIEQISGIRRYWRELGQSTRLCIWEKSNPSPMNGTHMWLSSIEACIFTRREGAVFSEHCSSAVWRSPTTPSKDHPTQSLLV